MLAAVLLSACRAPAIPGVERNTATPAPTDTRVAAGAQETLELFYDNYLSYPANALARRAYRDHPSLAPYLHPDWISEVDAILAGFEMGGYDPFLCAQALPIDLQIEPLETRSDRARYVLQGDFGGSSGPPFQVELTVGDSGWQITSIVCNPPGQPMPAAPPETSQEPTNQQMSSGWNSFRSEEYRFQLEYPFDWTPYINPVQDSSGRDPIEAYLVFQGPQGLEPIALVIIEGGLDGFRLVFPDPIRSEADDRFGKPVQVELHAAGETYYLIQDSPVGQPLVALRVIHREGPIPGELIPIIEAMLSSFVYLRPG